MKNPVVDALIDQIANAEDRETLVNLVRALDRVLQWNFYRVLSYGSPNERYAFWGNLKHPDRHPAKGLDLGSAVPVLWWHDPDSPDSAEQFVASADTTANTANDNVSRLSSDVEIEAEEVAGEGGANWVVIVALVGVVLLLWNFVRRRNR